MAFDYVENDFNTGEYLDAYDDIDEFDPYFVNPCYGCTMGDCALCDYYGGEDFYDTWED